MVKQHVMEKRLKGYRAYPLICVLRLLEWVYSMEMDNTRGIRVDMCCWSCKVDEYIHTRESRAKPDDNCMHNNGW
eukprot:676564-Pelagomonas_calceolata.AAC.2